MAWNVLTPKAFSDLAHRLHQQLVPASSGDPPTPLTLHVLREALARALKYPNAHDALLGLTQAHAGAVAKQGSSEETALVWLAAAVPLASSGASEAEVRLREAFHEGWDAVFALLSQPASEPLPFLTALLDRPVPDAHREPWCRAIVLAGQNGHLVRPPPRDDKASPLEIHAALLLGDVAQCAALRSHVTPEFDWQNGSRSGGCFLGSDGDSLAFQGWRMAGSLEGFLGWRARLAAAGWVLSPTSLLRVAASDSAALGLLATVEAEVANTETFSNALMDAYRYLLPKHAVGNFGAPITAEAAEQERCRTVFLGEAFRLGFKPADTASGRGCFESLLSVGFPGEAFLVAAVPPPSGAVGRSWLAAALARFETASSDRVSEGRRLIQALLDSGCRARALPTQRDDYPTASEKESERFWVTLGCCGDRDLTETVARAHGLTAESPEWAAIFWGVTKQNTDRAWDAACAAAGEAAAGRWLLGEVGAACLHLALNAKEKTRCTSASRLLDRGVPVSVPPDANLLPVIQHPRTYYGVAARDAGAAALAWPDKQACGLISKLLANESVCPPGSLLEACLWAKSPSLPAVRLIAETEVPRLTQEQKETWMREAISRGPRQGQTWEITRLLLDALVASGLNLKTLTDTDAQWALMDAALYHRHAPTATWLLENGWVPRHMPHVLLNESERASLGRSPEWAAVLKAVEGLPARESQPPRRRARP